MGKIVPPFVRSPFNYDVDEVSTSSGLKCEDVSLAQQQFKEESDINVILERFGVMAPQVNLPPQYGDFSGVYDFQSALNAVIEARHGFMQLPAKLRERFGNDPARLIAFLDDESNREEATRLGLIPETLSNVLGGATPEVPAKPDATSTK